MEAVKKFFGCQNLGEEEWIDETERIEFGGSESICMKP
jgi:hypothetical protein